MSGVSSAKRVIILGATSAIAEAAARTSAANSAALVLVGRNMARLDSIADDLRVRGATATHVVVMDLAAVDAGAEFARLAALVDAVDIVLVSYGTLGDQSASERDLAHARSVLETNFVSPAAWCLAAASYLESRGGGTLIVVGSVAGDRGRMSNYVYGAAKGGLAILTQGLAHRLAKSGARAVLIKPGFVDTPMTTHIVPKGWLWSRPEAIAAVVVGAEKGAASVIYAPWWWRIVMLVVRMMPGAMFHRTKL